MTGNMIPPAEPIPTHMSLSRIDGGWPGGVILTACPTLASQTALVPLDAQITHWQRTGVEMVITLVEEFELNQLGVMMLVSGLKERGMIWRHFPIRNMHAPDPADIPRLENLISDTAAILANDGMVVIHCHAGLGRTGLFAATLLRSFGITSDKAMAIVRSHRPGSIESTVQENFVLGWGFRLPEFPPGL